MITNERWRRDGREVEYEREGVTKRFLLQGAKKTKKFMASSHENIVPTKLWFKKSLN